jgi:zinc protease
MNRLFAATLAMLFITSSAVADDDIKIEPTKVSKPKKPDLRISLPPFTIDSKDFNFPSGLRIIMQPDTSQPIVSVTAFVDRGSKDDPVGKEGLAHFVEHLWFRSEHGDLPKVWNIIADMGAYKNASTADDWTNYMTVASVESLPAMLRLESLRITDTLNGVKEDVLDIEREVIRNELRQRKENGFMGTIPYIYDKLYQPDHPYARAGIGTHDSLDNCTLADAQEFVEKHYTPEQTTIVVVGNFDPELASNLIFENMAAELIHPDMKPEMVQRYISEKVPEGEEPDPNNPKHFVIWPLDPETATQDEDGMWIGEPLALGAPPVRISPDDEAPEPAPPKDRTPGFYSAPVERPTAVIAWSVPGGYRGSNDLLGQSAAQLVSRFLYYDPVDYSYSPLYENTIEVYHQAPELPGEKGDIEAGCFYWSSRFDSKVICTVDLTSSRYGESVAKMALDQIANIWNPDLNIEGSYRLSRMMTLSGLLNNSDIIADIRQGRATSVGQHAHYTGSASYISDAMTGYMSLKGLEVAHYASQYLRRDQAVTVILTPLTSDDRVIDSSDSDYGGAMTDSDIVQASMDTSLITPALVRETIVLPPVDKVRTVTLSNGLKVDMLQHGQVPLLDISIQWGGGDYTDETDFDYFAEKYQKSTRRSVVSGSDYDPLQIAGDWFGGTGRYHSYEGLRLSAGNIDGGLWLFREHLESRKPYVVAKSGWIKGGQGSVANAWVRRSYWDRQMQKEHQYPGHRLAEPATYEEYSIFEDVGTAEIKAYHDRKYHPANGRLVLVGDINTAGGYKVVAQKIEDALGGWAKGAPAAAPIDTIMEPLTDPKPSAVYISAEDPFDPLTMTNTQTDIYYSCRVAPTESMKDVATLQVLGHVLDAQAWLVLRERSGVTYGANARGSGRLSDGHSSLTLSSLVQNSATVFAIETFRELVEKAEAGELNDDQVQLAKLQIAKEYGLAQQTIRGMLNRLENRHGNYDEFAEYADGLASVTVEDVTKVIQGCQENAYISVDGWVKVNREQLEKAGVEYELVDWKAKGEPLLEAQDPKRFKKYLKRQAKLTALKAQEDQAKAESKEENSDSE